MTYVLLFAVLAVMRTAQAVSAKHSSSLIQDNRTLLHAGGFSNIVSALVALVALIVANDFSCDAFTVLTAAACGLCVTLATLTQYVSLRQSTIALNTMFGTASMLLPSIAGIFLFGETMSVWQWAGLVLFIAAAYFLICASSKEKAKMTWKGFLLLLGVFAFNGLSSLLQKYFAVEQGEAANATFFNFLCFAINGVLFYVITGVYCLAKREKFSLLPPKLMVWNGVQAAAVFAVGLLITVMAATLSSAVLFTVSGVIMLLANALVGAIGFKEKFTAFSVCGIVLSIAAAVCANIV